MAYPNEINNLIDVVGTDTLAEAGHSQRHNDTNTALESVRDFLNSGTAGQVLVGTGSASAPSWTSTGYRFHETIYYTSNGTFTKATYPWLRAIRVKVQGGGGGGAAGSTNNVHGGGGGGGGYGEKWITDIAGLSASVTVTVGSGGAGGTGSSGATGSAGGASSFGTATGAGGSGGSNIGGAGNSASNCDVAFDGSDAGTPPSSAPTGQWIPSGNGGASHLGGGGRAGWIVNGGRNNGSPGNPYGGGGAGGPMNDTGYNDGQAGAAGIVIVELYA